MTIHPMFSVARVEGDPMKPGVFKIQIAYRTGTWTYEDRAYASAEEAYADIPILQAEGCLPKNSELSIDRQ